MNDKLAPSLLLALATMACAGSAAAAGQSVYACTRADGSIELTSKKSGPECELLVSSDTPEPAADIGPAPGTPAAGGGAGVARTAEAAAAAASAATGNGDKAAVDPRKAYRDAMVQAAKNADPSAPNTNPALSRRYLAVDRATYLKSLAASAAQ